MQAIRSSLESMRSTVFIARRAFRTIHRFEGRRGLLACCLGEFRRGEIGSVETKLTVVTFTICPQLARLWHHRISKTLKTLNPKCVIVDSTGVLRSSRYQPASLVPMLNYQHGIKIDRILRRVRSKFVLICDDDVFLTGLVGIEWALEQFAQSEAVAAVSLKPRKRFRWPLNGNEYSPMGTYCLLLRPDIIRREALSFLPVHQPSPTPLSYNGEYDTGDFANVELLKRGYTIPILPQELQDVTFVAFHGMSSPIISLRANYPDLNNISPDQYRVLYRGLCSHAHLRDVYNRYFGEQSDWTILRGRAEDAFLEYLASELPADQKQDIECEVRSNIEKLMDAD